MNNNKNEAARAAAFFVNECLLNKHRGVLNYDDKIVIFGNDCYETDERAKEEVDLMKKVLVEQGLEPTEFATSDNGVSWAIVVRNQEGKTIDLTSLHDRLCECWLQACGMDELAV